MSNRDYYEEINYTNEVLMRIDKAMFMLKCNMDERRKGESPIFAESLI